MSVILGYGGSIQLSREWPIPTVFPQSSLTGAGTLLCREKAFWTGQRVLIYSHLGLPLRINGAAYAPSPDGHRFWGGLGVMGPNTDHRTNDAGIFWDASDASPFWEDATSTGFTQTTSAYIYRDRLDRISFYSSEIGAINKSQDLLIPFSQVQFDNLLIAAYDPATEYIAAVEALGEVIFYESPQAEEPATNYVDLPSLITGAADDPERRGWSTLVACKEWTLQTDPTVLDTTAIGEDFGDSVKDVVRGSGSFNGFVPVGQSQSGKIDAKDFVRLMLMTETGSKASARLRIQDESGVGNCKEECVWIECDILLGPGELSATFDNAVSYSSQFVVVKDSDGNGIKPVIGVFE
jgi:hypothetical protein